MARWDRIYIAYCLALCVLTVAPGCSGSPQPRSQLPSRAYPQPIDASLIRITKHSFNAKSLGVAKTYYVYLPEGYDTNATRRWPVLYLLHGMTQDETVWPVQGSLGAFANAAKFPAIIVMPDGDNSFYSNAATPTAYQACLTKGTGLLDPRVDHATACVRTPKYEDYIVGDLIAEIDSHYRTNPQRAARGIAGLSMGGFGAFMLAMRHTDFFSAAASHSGVLTLLFAGPYPYRPGDVRLVEDVATWGEDIGVFGRWFRGVFGAQRANWLAHDPSELIKQLPVGALALYLDCGTEDEFVLYNGARYVHDLLTERGVEHAYYEGAGRHNFEFWQRRLPSSLGFFAAHFAMLR